MTINYLIYEDGVIAVKLSAENAGKAEKRLFNLAIRYLKPQDITDESDKIISKTTNIMGGETD